MDFVVLLQHQNCEIINKVWYIFMTNGSINYAKYNII